MTTDEALALADSLAWWAQQDGVHRDHAIPGESEHCQTCAHFDDLDAAAAALRALVAERDSWQASYERARGEQFVSEQRAEKAEQERDEVANELMYAERREHEAEQERDRLFLESQRWHGEADLLRAALEGIVGGRTGRDRWAVDDSDFAEGLMERAQKALAASRPAEGAE